MLHIHLTQRNPQLIPQHILQHIHLMLHIHLTQHIPHTQRNPQLIPQHIQQIPQDILQQNLQHIQQIQETLVVLTDCHQVKVSTIAVRFLFWVLLVY